MAYYWTGSIPKPKVVRDIGLCGAYILAADIFYPRTVIQISFEDVGQKRNDGLPTPHICVWGRVCRKTSEGFCVAFFFSDSQERLQMRKFLHGLKRKAPRAATAVPDGSIIEQAEAGCEPESEDFGPTETRT